MSYPSNSRSLTPRSVDTIELKGNEEDDAGLEKRFLI
jgi:hypothetical protein